MYQLQTLSGGPVGFRAACKPQRAASANLLGYKSRYTLHVTSYLFILKALFAGRLSTNRLSLKPCKKMQCYS